MRNVRQCFFRVVLLLLLLVPAIESRAAVPVIEAQVNVPYVVQFGFGSYDVGGLSTNTFRIPIPHTFDLGEGSDAPKLRFTGYLGYTMAEFETRLLGPKLIASQDYVFIMPQAELEIPLSPGWTLKPFIAVGAGCAFNGSIRFEGMQKTTLQDSYDFLYMGGVSSLYEIPLGGFTAGFGTKLGWAEEVPLDEGRGQGYATLQTGLEVKHPLPFGVAGRRLDLSGSFIFYYFFPAAKFTIPGEHPLEVSHQYEFGTTVGFAKAARLWIFDNPRIGASYRFGDGLTGFRFNFGFPF